MRSPQMDLTPTIQPVSANEHHPAAVRLKAGTLRFYMSPDEAYRVANALVDAAEQLEVQHAR